MPKGGVTKIKDHQKSGRGFKRKGWEADKSWDMSKDDVPKINILVIASAQSRFSILKFEPQGLN